MLLVRKWVAVGSFRDDLRSDVGWDCSCSIFSTRFSSISTVRVDLSFESLNSQSSSSQQDIIVLSSHTPFEFPLIFFLFHSTLYSPPQQPLSRMNTRETENLLSITESPYPTSYISLEDFDKPKHSSSHLKSSLTKMSENLCFFEREGRKIAEQRSKDHSIKQNMTITYSNMSETPKCVRPMSRRLRPRSSKNNHKDRMLETKSTFVGGDLPTLTIRKMEPRKLELEKRSLEMTRERSKRLLSSNMIKKAKQTKQLKEPKPSKELKETKTTRNLTHNKGLRHPSVSLFLSGSKQRRPGSEYLIKGCKVRLGCWQIDRRLSEEYQLVIERTIQRLHKCHDILTTIDMHQ